MYLDYSVTSIYLSYLDVFSCTNGKYNTCIITNSSGMIYDLRQQVSTILIITGIKPYQCFTYIELSVIKYISVLRHKIHTGDKSAQMVVWLKIYFNINVLQINTIHTRENLFQCVFQEKYYDFVDQ